MGSRSQLAGALLRGLPGGGWCLHRAAGARAPAFAPIFMFHRVLPDPSQCYDPELAVSTATCELFLNWLAHTYEVVPLAELRPRRRQGRPQCALTFDDGWLDTFTQAFPLLQRVGLPATVFLPLKFIGRERRFWQEALYFHLRNLRDRADGLEALAAVAAQFPWCPLPQPADLGYRRLSARLRRRTSAEAEDFVRRLGDVAGSSLELAGRAFMNWDEVLRMQDAGIEFGSHTLEHTFLATAPPALAESELRDSRLALGEQLDRDVTAIAYPWGALSPFTRPQAATAGYRFGVTVEPGLAAAGSDPLLLPRVAVSEAQLAQPNPPAASARRRFWPGTIQIHLLRARRHTARRPVALDSDGRLRIAILVDQAQIWADATPALRGGSELQLYHMLLALDPRYFAVELCFLSAPPHGLPTRSPWPCYVGARAGAGRLGRLAATWRLLHRRRPALAFAMFQTSLFQGVPAAWLARVPAIVCSRRNAGYWRRWYHWPLLACVNRMATGWQVNGAALADLLAESEGIPSTRIDILPNWLDLERFQPGGGERRARLRQELGLPPDAFVVVSVANYSPVKDLPTLIAAAARIGPTLPSARFLLIGHGDDRERLQAEIDRLGAAAWAQLLGARENVPDYLAAADVGVLTSQSEGCSNSVLEYMASGLPLVLSDIPANRCLSPGELFPVGDSAALANALLDLAAHPERAAARGAANRARMAPYTQGSYTERVQAHFTGLAAAGRRPKPAGRAASSSVSSPSG